MTHNEHDSNPQGSTPSTKAGSEMASNYFVALKALLTQPDDFFGEGYRDQKLFGLINLIALVIIIALAGFVQRAGYGDVSFGDFLGGLKHGLAYAVPLAALLFVYPWYAKQQGHSLSIDFLIEKLGGAVALSAILILLAVPLNLLNITLHSWLRGAGIHLLYIAVFLTAYWYVAPRKLAVATIAVVAFYFAYRLISLLL